MKTKTIRVIEIVYLAAMLLVSLFYVFANFDKVISAQLGLAQLLFTVIVILIYSFILDKKKGLPDVIYVLYSLAQTVAAFCWIVYFRATFQVFPHVKAINWLGLLIHLMLFAWGLGMIFFARHKKTKAVNI